MSARGIIVFLVSALIQGTVAKTCVRGYLNCLFGCCTDGYFIYCCLSNSAGFGIIFGVIVMVLSSCAICFGVRRHRALYSHRVAGQQTVNVSGTTVTQSQTTQYQFGQPNTGYGPPNPGNGQPNMTAGFGIIFGVIVMVLSTCAICFGVRRHRALYSHRVAGQQTVNVSGTTVTQSQTTQYQFGQPNTGYGQPNTGYGPPNPGYGQPNMTYATAPPPYSG